MVKNAIFSDFLVVGKIAYFFVNSELGLLVYNTIYAARYHERKVGGCPSSFTGGKILATHVSADTM